MRLSLTKAISERTLTRIAVAYFVCAPLVFGLYLGMIPGNGGNGFVRVLFAILWALPPSLVACAIAAVVFHQVRWRRATWISVMIPLLLIGIALLMILVGLATDLDGM